MLGGIVVRLRVRIVKTFSDGSVVVQRSVRTYMCLVIIASVVRKSKKSWWRLIRKVP
jgi:hypothetical protein